MKVSNFMPPPGLMQSPPGNLESNLCQTKNLMPPPGLMQLPGNLEPYCDSASLDSYRALKQEFVALERKYEALALENARLTNENMTMRMAQLAQENMMLRLQSQSMPGTRVAEQRWWQQPNALAMPRQVGYSPGNAAEHLPKSTMQLAPGQSTGNKIPEPRPSLGSSSPDTESTCVGSSSPDESTAGDEDVQEVESIEDSTKKLPRLLTTVMMRNIPNNLTREQLLDIMNAEGFVGCYDFVYLPVDFKNMVGLGYTFVNLVDSEVAKRFYLHFSGFSRWVIRSSLNTGCWDPIQSEKVCEVTWSDGLQGKDAHIERYMNSPVMHHSMPDSCKPMIFKDGVPILFPKPTKRLRAPRHCPQGN